MNDVNGKEPRPSQAIHRFDRNVLPQQTWSGNNPLVSSREKVIERIKQPSNNKTNDGK